MRLLVAFSTLYFILAVILVGLRILSYSNKYLSLDTLLKWLSGCMFGLTVLDLVFIIWVYHALSSTLRVLREFQQQEKYRLYLTLFSVFTSFLVFFSVYFLVYSVFLFVDASYLAWVVDEVNESVRVAIMLTLAYMLWPTPTSRLLAYYQLPMSSSENNQEEDENCSRSVQSRDGERELELGSW